MDAGTYVVAVLATLLFTAGITVAAIRLRRRLVPGWVGPVGAIAAAVIGLTLVTVLAEALGLLQVMSRWPLVAGALLCAAATLLLRMPPQLVTPPAPRLQALRSPWVLLGAVCVLATVGQALWGAWRTMHVGVYYTDSLQYHLTDAARFAAGHSVRHVWLANPNTAVPWYPLNDELLNGVGMSLFGRDTLTLLLGFGDMAAAYTAAWCLGRRGGLAGAGLALAGTSFLFAVLGPSYEPSGLNDWHAAWPALAAIVLLARVRDDRLAAIPRPPILAGVALAGLAAGQAAGTKLDLLAVAAAVFVVAVAAAQGARGRAAVTFVVAAVVAGGYWYVRDIVVVHNPLPEVQLSVAGHALPRPPLGIVDKLSYSVAHYLTNGSVISHYFEPGLHYFFGPIWPLALICFAVGLLGGLLPGRPWAVRAAAAVGVVGTVAYVFTPTGAAGAPGAPVLFQYNLRYDLPAFLIAMVVLPLLVRRTWWWVLLGAVDVALLVSVLSQRAGWADGQRVPGVPATVALIVIVAVAVMLWVHRGGGRAVTAVAVTIAVVGLIAAGYPLQRFWLQHRYNSGFTGLERIYTGFYGVHDTRIGYAGYMFAYPLLGADLSNPVSYVGRPAPHDGLVNEASCTQWRRALTAGGYRYVVIGNQLHTPLPVEWEWTRTDPSARLLLHDNQGVVVGLTGPSPVQGCPSGTPTTGSH